MTDRSEPKPDAAKRTAKSADDERETAESVGAGLGELGAIPDDVPASERAAAADETPSEAGRGFEEAPPVDRDVDRQLDPPRGDAAD